MCAIETEACVRAVPVLKLDAPVSTVYPAMMVIVSILWALLRKPLLFLVLSPLCRLSLHHRWLVFVATVVGIVVVVIVFFAGRS